MKDEFELEKQGMSAAVGEILSALRSIEII